MEDSSSELSEKDYRAEEVERKPSDSSVSHPKSNSAEPSKRWLPSRMSKWFRSKPEETSELPTYHSQTQSSTPEEFPVGIETQDHNNTGSPRPPSYTDEARDLIRTLTAQPATNHDEIKTDAEAPTGFNRYAPDIDYVPAPDHYKPSVFATILASKLRGIQHEITGQNNRLSDLKQDQSRNNAADQRRSQHAQDFSHDSSAANSGNNTPSKKIRWHDKPEPNHLANLLVSAGLSSTGPGMPNSSNALPWPKIPNNKSPHKLASGTDSTTGLASRHHKSNSVDSERELVKDIADIIACREYLTKLCGALMQFGAPTHRMEAYLSASARSLSIEAEFLYIPGAMICTFIDHSILANNVEVVRQSAGLDFGKLKDVFNVYKNVIHDKFSAQEGIWEIEKILKRRNRHSDLFRILMFGLAGATAGPFSFNTRPIDFAPIFILGCILGFMQIKVVPRSEQFSNVFEVSACVFIAFIARALGSIKYSSGEYIFCFSGVAQSSIAMILPGFLVLNSALELQGKNMVSGSVRMVYAIIYVLFLGFGLLIGTTIFGLIKHDAVDSVSCQVPEWFAPEYNYKLLYTRFVWAPLFASCIALVYQAKWRQLPVMALIALAGHQANFWISTQLSSNLQVANAIGAFVIGCLANLYSRMFHGLAAAAMLPAIYCQVPGGLAASGSLVAGVASSNQITGNSSSVSVINNGTSGFVAAQDDPNSVYGGTIYNVGYGMVQVSIGISVGLYLSALVIYPFGKRRSGLFSF